MQVQTDHQIAAFGVDEMQLLDNTDSGKTLVTAIRADDVWTISAEGVDDVTAVDRATAITKMTEQALAILPGTGYSTFLPRDVELLDLLRE